MNDKWVNRIVFWLLCIVPFALLITTSKRIDPLFTICGILLYAVWYRPLVHIYRLRQLRAIDERDAWKLFIPFYHNRYFRALWLG